VVRAALRDRHRGLARALVVLQTFSRTHGGPCSDNFSLPGVQFQQGLDVLKKHDPAAGGHSSQIVLHDKQGSLASLGSQMSTTIADLQKLPHVLAAQNPLSGTPTKVGPLSSDGKTACITVRFDVQPSTLGDGYLHGADDAVQPLRSAGAEAEYGGPLGELARPGRAGM
jgi:RND superfamily putative drug exporter